MVATAEIVGANAERSRTHNRQMVMNRVRKAGQIGRAEIARESGLSIQAVSNIIADLMADGLLMEQGRRPGSRGQPPVQYGLNPYGGYAVGIEIRPDAVFAAALDLCGTPVASVRHSLDASDLEGVTDAVRSAMRAVTREAEAPQGRVLGAGIVMPGPFGATGLNGTGSELSFLHEVSPQEWFAGVLGLPVVIENDANAAAVAERVTGVAKGLETFAFVYFGKGLGLGMVQSGRLVTGAFGNAGEIGHIPVPSGGEMVALESVLSRMSLQRHLAAHGVRATTSDELAEAYASKTPSLAAWLDTAVEPLSAAVAFIENIIDPETVILGGAMPNGILDRLIETTRLAERSVSARGDRSSPRLMRGSSGRMTATLGAAALVINQTFTPRIAAAA